MFWVFFFLDKWHSCTNEFETLNNKWVVLGFFFLDKWHSCTNEFETLNNKWVVLDFFFLDKWHSCTNEFETLNNKWIVLVFFFLDKWHSCSKNNKERCWCSPFCHNRNSSCDKCKSRSWLDKKIWSHATTYW